MKRERRRHYVITLQRLCEDGVTRFSTQYGDLTGDVDEADAFLRVWKTACETWTEHAKPLGWEGTAFTVENSAVLFYRLADLW